VPKSASEISFATLSTTLNGKTYTFTPEQQSQAFQWFIGSHLYLSKYKGQIVERNGGEYLWLTRFDFTVEQDINVKVGAKNKKNIIRLRADIFNVGNLLVNKWGVASAATASSVSGNNTLSNVLNYASLSATGVPSCRMAFKP
jgi:hypothetical protein